VFTRAERTRFQTHCYSENFVAPGIEPRTSGLAARNSDHCIYCISHFSLNLNSSPSIIRIIKSRKMRWAGHVARMGEKRNVYRLLVGRPEGKRLLGRPRHRWIYNVKMDL
jgi:hypothetical protein